MPRKRRSKKAETNTGFLTTSKFQHILRVKYGLSIPIDELRKALTGPRSAVIQFERVPLPERKVMIQGKPYQPKRGRMSYIERELRRKVSTS